MYARTTHPYKNTTKAEKTISQLFMLCVYECLKCLDDTREDEICAAKEIYFEVVR